MIVDLNASLLNTRGYSKAALANDAADQGRKLVRVLQKFSLANIINQPTRISETSKTLIDISLNSEY